MKPGWKCSEMYRKSLICLGFVLVVAQPANGGDLPDPTRPPRLRAAERPTTVTGPSDWQLRMTRTSSGQAVAVLNGKVVQPGDQVAGARVLAIRPSVVELSKGKKRFQVKLPRVFVKRPATSERFIASEAARDHVK